MITDIEVARAAKSALAGRIAGDPHVTTVGLTGNTETGFKIRVGITGDGAPLIHEWADGVPVEVYVTGKIFPHA